MTTIIGLTGHAGSGKDTVAALLAERFNVCRLAFADSLKHEIAHAFGIDRQLLENPFSKGVQTDQLALRNCTEPGFCAYSWGLAMLDAVTPRTIMQTWGDWRRGQDPDYFVKRTTEVMRTVIDDVDAVILTDCRFPNEAQMVSLLNGELWRIVRPDGPKPTRHPSEWLLDGHAVNAEIVNDGSTEQLAKIATDLFLYALGRREAA